MDTDDDNQSIAIANLGNKRIVEWKMGEKNEKLIAEGRVWGNRVDQLHYPANVLINKNTSSLLIAARWNGRAVRCFRCQGTTQDEVVFDNIDCCGLAMDHHE